MEPRIVLRGSRSITGNNEALVVIDNAISSSTVLQQLPPELIASVNVIKGMQGAALYGEQGVNGVIIVTTVKGKEKGKSL
jgi:TonB-dependent SusC/RagA subfamily outer membrane receptor